MFTYVRCQIDRDHASCVTLWVVMKRTGAEVEHALLHSPHPSLFPEGAAMLVLIWRQFQFRGPVSLLQFGV
jgi:hypothetical protein